MARIINYTSQALIDLADLYTTIAIDSPASALKHCSEFMDALDSLVEFPHRHPVVGTVDDMEVRLLVHQRTVALYTVMQNSVEIFSIVRGGRDFLAQLESLVRRSRKS